MPYGRKRTNYRSKNKRYSYSTRKKAKSYPARTRYTGRKTYRKASALRAKWLNPLSQKSLLKFVYTDSSFSRTLNVAGGYTAYYVFRGNSLYDPDYTGVGVQPYGYDQYVGAALYSNWRVTSSSISVYFRPEETYASMRRLHAVIIPMRNPAPILTDISDVRNIPFHKETTYDGLTESTKGAKMKSYASCKQMHAEYDTTDRDLSGTYLGNPTIVFYWIVMFYTDVFDDEEVDIYFDVKIKYYSILSRGDVPNES